MTMESKHDLSQDVYVLHNGSRIKKARIINILCKANSNNSFLKITYTVQLEGTSSLNDYPEHQVYLTKAEAAYAWLSVQELESREVLQGFLAQERGD